jgi:uncharacterized Zn finger protein
MSPRKKNLSWLTESYIRKLCTEQSFQRGHDYFQASAILRPVIMGNTLMAECEGTDYQPYSVTVSFSKGEINSASCSCPYDWGGFCKHIVALLLIRIHRPEDFASMDDVRTQLKRMTKTQLSQLIWQMAEHDPAILYSLANKLQSGDVYPASKDSELHEDE